MKPYSERSSARGVTNSRPCPATVSAPIALKIAERRDIMYSESQFFLRVRRPRPLLLLASLQRRSRPKTCLACLLQSRPCPVFITSPRRILTTAIVRWEPGGTPKYPVYHHTRNIHRFRAGARSRKSSCDWLLSE